MTYCLENTIVGKNNFAFANTAVLDLLGYQVLFGDLDLFALGVTRKIQYLETILKRRRDRMQNIRRRNKKHLRQIVINVEIMIPKCSVLLRIEYLKQRPEKLYTKTSVMIGLGETDEELDVAFRQLREAGVDVLTLGQYLQPSQYHLRVERFVTPAQFEQYKKLAESYGFLYVASGPLVRSSYRAAEFFMKGLMERERLERNG